jgi:hypothetical protein
MTPCGHVCCTSCLKDWIGQQTKQNNSPRCPLCKTDISSIASKPLVVAIIIKKIIDDLWIKCCRNEECGWKGKLSDVFFHECPQKKDENEEKDLEKNNENSIQETVQPQSEPQSEPQPKPPSRPQPQPLLREKKEMNRGSEKIRKELFKKENKGIFNILNGKNKKVRHIIYGEQKLVAILGEMNTEEQKIIIFPGIKEVLKIVKDLYKQGFRISYFNYIVDRWICIMIKTGDLREKCVIETMIDKFMKKISENYKLNYRVFLMGYGEGIHIAIMREVNGKVGEQILIKPKLNEFWNNVSVNKHRMCLHSVGYFNNNWIGVMKKQIEDENHIYAKDLQELLKQIDVEFSKKKYIQTLAIGPNNFQDNWIGVTRKSDFEKSDEYLVVDSFDELLEKCKGI